jgi:hypothetical protein
VAQVGTALLMLAVFLGIYFTARRRRGATEPVQWGWLAAIVGCAAVAVLIGAITR